MFKLNLAIWPQKPPKLLLLTEASVITESSVNTEDREFSAEGFRPKLLPKITPEASAEVNFVLTLGKSKNKQHPDDILHQVVHNFT